MRLLRLSTLMPVSLAAVGALVVAGALAAPAQAQAALTITPASLTFGSQAVGTTSAPQTLTATNTGTATMLFNNVSISGDPADFGLGTDNCIGINLPAGDSCTVQVVFSPASTGTHTADVVFTDTAAGSPQTVPLTGTGTGTNPPLAIDDQFYSCANNVCDISGEGNPFLNNFFTNSFEATGGAPPYTWSGTVPAGLTLRPSGLLVGAATTLGTQTFTVTVTDSAGATATGTFSLTVTNTPSPPGCQTGRKLKEALSGPAFNGQVPTGTALANASRSTGCTLSVSVKKVNLPDSTQLWVTLDGLSVGTINLSHGSGTMATYNLGDFQVSMDQVAVFSSFPDVSPFQQILTGGSFT
jgi:hypothetical protein